jgi:hypothetical protein
MSLFTLRIFNSNSFRLQTISMSLFYSMRVFLVSIFLFSGPFTDTAKAKEKEMIISLISAGEGKSKEDAINKALRSAVEQAFGVFVSSNTEILNDQLIKDDMTSISQGNIERYEIISDTKGDGEGHIVSLSVDVSVGKMVKYVEGKGGKLNFNGSILAFNIEQQKLRESNEVKAVEDLLNYLQNYYKGDYFDYHIKSHSNPEKHEGELWAVPLVVEARYNKNFTNVIHVICQTLKSLSLTNEESKQLIKQNVSIFPFYISTSKSESEYVVLRNTRTVQLINSFFSSSFSKSYCVFTNNDDCIAFGINKEINPDDLAQELKMSLLVKHAESLLLSEQIKQHNNCRFYEDNIKIESFAFMQLPTKSDLKIRAGKTKHNILNYTGNTAMQYGGYDMTGHVGDNGSREASYFPGSVIEIKNVETNNLFYKDYLFDIRSSDGLKLIKSYKVKKAM